MQQIAERAKKQYPDRVVKYPSDDIPYNKYMSNRRLGYIHGATDQHKIEVKKAIRLVSVLLDKLEVEHKDIWLQTFSDAMEEMI